ncbi:transposase [Streptomyces hygroscopicus]|uniref:transposase n=1 Tax=Streptomyces hygroscopicus TaxID=1912 RepID=UPI00379B2B88
MPLTDAQWARIEPLLPDRTPKRGGRWRDHREVIDAIAGRSRSRVRRGRHPRPSSRRIHPAGSRRKQPRNEWRSWMAARSAR